MIYLLDVNLLMAALWSDHVHHSKGRSWLGSVASFATCPMTQMGFARVSSNPDLGYSFEPEEAFRHLRKLLSDERHRFIPDTIGCEDRVLRTELMRSSKQITDHYLVALARENACCLATLDEPLAQRYSDEPSVVELVS